MFSGAALTTNERFKIDAGDWCLEFLVSENGRLIQLPLGEGDLDSKHPIEAFPAAGNGWILEPAVKITHADGNTSSDFRVVACQAESGITRVDLKDPEFPIELSLFFRAVPSCSVIEC